MKLEFRRWGELSEEEKLECLRRFLEWRLSHCLGAVRVDVFWWMKCPYVPKVQGTPARQWWAWVLQVLQRHGVKYEIFETWRRGSKAKHILLPRSEAVRLLKSL